MLWETIARLEVVEPLLLPAFSRVAVRVFEGIVQGELLLQVGQSIVMVVAGLMVSMCLGTLMVYLDYNYPVIRDLLEVLASLFHPLPGIALLPIIMIWAGIGPDAVFIVIIHAVLWSYYLNLKTGFAMIDKSLIEAAGNNGASKMQLFRYVLLPGSVESVKTGIRVGWSRGWRGLISAEMIFGAISSIGGIGWYMYERRAFGDVVGTYAGILLVAAIGVVVEQVLFKHTVVND